MTLLVSIVIFVIFVITIILLATIIIIIIIIMVSYENLAGWDGWVHGPPPLCPLRGLRPPRCWTGDLLINCQVFYKTIQNIIEVNTLVTRWVLYL